MPFAEGVKQRGGLARTAAAEQPGRRQRFESLLQDGEHRDLRVAKERPRGRVGMVEQIENRARCSRANRRNLRAASTRSPRGSVLTGMAVGQSRSRSKPLAARATSRPSLEPNRLSMARVVVSAVRARSRTASAPTTPRAAIVRSGWEAPKVTRTDPESELTPDFRIEAWPGQGHFVHLVDPQHFTETLRQFVGHCTLVSRPAGSDHIQPATRVAP